MSLKDTIVQWSEGADLALEGKSEEAIGIWTAMQEPGARILFNIASMHLLLGNLDKAEKVWKKTQLPSCSCVHRYILCCVGVWLENVVVFLCVESKSGHSKGSSSVPGLFPERVSLSTETEVCSYEDLCHGHL